MYICKCMCVGIHIYSAPHNGVCTPISMSYIYVLVYILVRKTIWCTL